MKVKESALRDMFSSEKSGDAALDTFFELHENGPMNFEYRLKDGIEVIDDIEDPAYEGLGGTLLAVANFHHRNKRHKKYLKLVKNRPQALRLVSEGDSWFQHPQIEDTIDHLYNYYNIRSLGAAGDTLINIVRKKEYLWTIEQEKPSAFLLSGLGNDVMDNFASRLHHYFTDDGRGPRRLLRDDLQDPDSYSSQLRDGLARYRQIASEVGARFPHLPMLVHGYDYVNPGEGRKDKWLHQPMNGLQIPHQEQAAVLRIVINDLDQELAKFADDFANVHHVRCLNKAPHPWHDEIHPDALGFAQVAATMHQVLQQVL